jgi:hypothetical protein
MALGFAAEVGVNLGLFHFGKEAWVGLDYSPGLLAKDPQGSLHVLVDGLQLPGREAGGQIHHGCSQAFVEPAEPTECLGQGADEDFTAVSRVAEALDEAGVFKAVEDAGNGTGRQAGGASEISCCRGPLLITSYEFEASGISNVQADLAGDGFVEKGGDGAEFAAEVHADSLDEFFAFAGCGGHGNLS